MELLLCVLLRVVHWTNSIITLLTACWRSFRWTPPLPLGATRRVTPRHLALLLVPDGVCDAAVTRKCLLESVRRTAGWCRVVGIEKLTVYDSQGLLMECADEISQHVSSTSEPTGYDSSSGSDIDYPLTPPASDCSDSWSPSPGGDLHKDASAINMRLIGSARKRSSRYGLQMRNHDKRSEASKRPLKLCIASRQSSKPAIAAAATALARRHHARADSQPKLSVDLLTSILEGPHSVSAPDFLILHHLRQALPPLELHGFPPWQLRLTEIHLCSGNRPLLEGLKDAPQALTEIDFRAALDDFGAAEMRFGQ